MAIGKGKISRTINPLHFEERAKTVKPEIERNKILLETMLTAYQESYRFWVSVSEEAASNYDERGVQAAKGRNHGFRARA